jgi:tRNA U55 pseudouridine synthase TruB
MGANYTGVAGGGSVEDRWVIRAEEKGVQMETTMEVKFSKGTYLRKIIESRSKGDMLTFHQK